MFPAAVPMNAPAPAGVSCTSAFTSPVTSGSRPPSPQAVAATALATNVRFRSTDFIFIFESSLTFLDLICFDSPRG